MKTRKKEKETLKTNLKNIEVYPLGKNPIVTDGKWLYSLSFDDIDHLQSIKNNQCRYAGFVWDYERLPLRPDNIPKGKPKIKFNTKNIYINDHLFFVVDNFTAAVILKSLMQLKKRYWEDDELKEGVLYNKINDIRIVDSNRMVTRFISHTSERASARELRNILENTKLSKYFYYKSMPLDTNEEVIL